MKNIIDKIKNFFKRIFGKNDTKLLNQASINEKEQGKINEKKLKDEEKQDTLNYFKNNKEEFANDKKEVLDIYKKIKNGECNPDDLDDEKREKINALVKTEIEIKKRHLEEKTTELKMLRRENMSNEKHRIIDLYYQVQDGEVNLESIEYEDLIKIRKLLLEETKMRDKLIEEDLIELTTLVSSGSTNI